MSNKVLDFSSFGEELWRIADVFRDDTLKTTEYLEEFSYFFFLKLWDDRERAEQFATEELGETYIPYLPEDMRFYAWAEDPDAAAAEHGFESVSVVSDLDEAVNTAFDNTRSGYAVLLSPACASWDMYPSFEHRGDHFRECFENLRRR